jgi:hypothetical protein
VNDTVAFPFSSLSQAEETSPQLVDAVVFDAAATDARHAAAASTEASAKNGRFTPFSPYVVCFDLGSHG